MDHSAQQTHAATPQRHKEWAELQPSIAELMDKNHWHSTSPAALGFWWGLILFIYLFILRVTVEKYFLSANAELQLDFPSGNCNMEDSDFGLSFANNTMQMLSFKDRSYFSEDEQQTGAGKSPIIYFPDI